MRQPLKVHHTHNAEIPATIVRFVEEALIPSITGVPEPNQVLAVMLGGAHSKWLQNSKSDVDLVLYYTTTAENLLRFNRTTLSVVPSGRFVQTKTEPVLYEWPQDAPWKFELDVVPVRRVGQGNDLFTNLHKNNMKTIHDLTKDYNIFPRKKDDVWFVSDYARWFRLIEFVLRDLDLSVDAAVGYFQGYMTSQLMSHRRRNDYEKREKKAWETYDVSPVVKAIMNGMYIGLSGLYLLDALAVSRDFRQLWEVYQDRFLLKQRDFIWKCYWHKTDKHPITQHVDDFLRESAVFRDELFSIMNREFDEAKVPAVASGRFNERCDQKANDEAIDQFQLEFLEL